MVELSDEMTSLINTVSKDGDDPCLIEVQLQLIYGNLDSKTVEKLCKKESFKEAEYDLILEMITNISCGENLRVLKSTTAKDLLGKQIDHVSDDKDTFSLLRSQVYNYCTNPVKRLEVQILGIASLNLFMQLNYTGPSFDISEIDREIYPHQLLRKILTNPSFTSSNETEHLFQNSILTELSVEGEWPHHLCHAPYFFLLARALLLSVADLSTQDMHESNNPNSEDENNTEKDFSSASYFFEKMWSARAVIAHQRLFINMSTYSDTLYDELQHNLQYCVNYLEAFQGDEATAIGNEFSARFMLEAGLGHHHFTFVEKAKTFFYKALKLSGLSVQVTGALGVRTKFQTKDTAQLLVRAKPLKSQIEANEEKDCFEKPVTVQSIDPDEDVLLEKVKYTEKNDNIHYKLSYLDSSILLALCLDVKNQNPNDELTAEEMTAYIERVLNDHDDWMIYSTALLERAWLEFECSKQNRERALLQIQALVDQHTNTLTLTQSTTQSITEHSAPVQQRLRNLHLIVYPPRWYLQRDLADKYVNIGIVTSAADIYEKLEMWDEVVQCYKLAGRESQAKTLVFEKLKDRQTPRMFTAIGDLTKDPSYYEKAIIMSKSRFFDAHYSYGRFYFNEKQDLANAAKHLKIAVEIRPLSTPTWFLLGTIYMRLEDWDGALVAFSQVVTQKPEEGDAWANVGAIHMKNHHSEKAYHAFNESLRQNRNNWRVWTSKLYACIDLEKYDEAINSCHELLKFQSKKSYGVAGAQLEEKCVKAIVGGIIKAHDKATLSKDGAAIDSTSRSLERACDLVNQLSSAIKSEAWIWETHAFLNAKLGNSEKILQDLMKEYRILQNMKGWETDETKCEKICRLSLTIYEIQKDAVGKQDLLRCNFMLKKIVKNIKAAYIEKDKYPSQLPSLETALIDIEERIRNLN